MQGCRGAPVLSPVRLGITLAKVEALRGTRPAAPQGVTSTPRPGAGAEGGTRALSAVRDAHLGAGFAVLGLGAGRGGRRSPRARPGPPAPAALTAFFFCTILSIFLAMRTTSSSMAPAGLPRAQPARNAKQAKLRHRRR